MTISKRDIKKELTNYLRNSDIISPTDRGVTQFTENFSGDGIQTDFVLTGTGVGNGGIKNIRTVTVDSVALTFGTDWVMSDDFQTITFTTAPAIGVDNVEIEHDYSATGDKIYPDFNKVITENSTFPIIGFDILATISEGISLGGSAFRSTLQISFVGYERGANASDDLIEEIRDKLFQNRLNWFYLNYLRPDNEGPLLKVDGTNDKIFQRNTDWEAAFEFECP